MILDTSSITLESIASVILAVGLVSVYLFSGRSTGTAASHPPVPQVPQKPVNEGKKKKKGKGADSDMAKPTQVPRFPGGNDSFGTSSAADEIATEDPALVVASLEAGVAAQEYRGKTKKSKKKTRDRTPKQSQDIQPPTPRLNQATPTTSIDKAPPFRRENEGEWRVVGRSRRADTTAESQASFTTTSGTDGSPKEEVSNVDSVEISKPIAERSMPKGRMTTDENLPANSTPPAPARDASSHTDSITPTPTPLHPVVAQLEESTEISDKEESDNTESDGFIPVRGKGRRRSQRSVSNQSLGGGGARASETLTKRQRQNQAKRAAQKATRAEAEQQRLETLARHRKDSEQARIQEIYQKGKQLSGGMSMSVGNSGKAEWD